MDYESIVADINERISHYTDSRQPTSDEVKICWLIGEVERLKAAQEQPAASDGDCRCLPSFKQHFSPVNGKCPSCGFNRRA